MSSQLTWKDRVKAAASASTPDEAANPLLKTLQEFCAALNESPWIRAELRPTSHPRRLVLVVSPKYRRDINAMMLTFLLTSSGVIVSGVEQKDLKGEEELSQLLVDFVEKSAFPDTVAEFQALQREHVHGLLRVKSLRDDDQRDVSVLVDAGDHNELARRALAGKLDAPLGLGVVIDEPPSVGTFDETIKYAFLDSGGFALRIRNWNRISESTIKVYGDIVALSDLPQLTLRGQKGAVFTLTHPTSRGAGGADAGSSSPSRSDEDRVVEVQEPPDVPGLVVVLAEQCEGSGLQVLPLGAGGGALSGSAVAVRGRGGCLAGLRGSRPRQGGVPCRAPRQPSEAGGGAWNGLPFAFGGTSPCLPGLCPTS